ncbi:MAG: serine/threonine protein kinase [Myxococcales bacterium]|nr:serine/threonine protein kinase [Myxococcales bacterium]
MVRSLASLHTGPTSLGRYRLVRHLASGGMGEVYLAEAMGAAGFAKRVVVKTLRADLANDAQLAEQLVAEGRLLEALDHPNIAQIFDLGQQAETFWLAMEYVDGFDLRGLLRAMPQVDGQRSLSSPAVLYVVACVARALEHAQTRLGPNNLPLGVVHHDVSPSNVMIRRDGHVKLVDFGVAKAALLGKMNATALRGKLPYLSPEHANHQPVDGRADLFALGLVAYELVTGERAMDVAEPEQLARAHERLPARVAAMTVGRVVDTELTRIIADLLALHAADRPPDAAAVAARAYQSLVRLGHASPERLLADELAPAFDRLVKRVGSFDATLAGILGLADSAPSADRTGTLSLPGLDVLSIAAASAKDDTGAGRKKWHKRWITLGIAVVAVAIGGGFWAGQTVTTQPDGSVGTKPQTEAKAQLAVVAEAPVEAVVGLAAAPTPGLAVAAVPIAATLAQAEPSARLETDSVRPQTDSVRPQTDQELAAKTAGLRPKAKEKSGRTATLLFRVRPAGCRVVVDGELKHPVANTDRYEVRVTAGDHRVIVEDLVSGLKKHTNVRDVLDGEARTLAGGICLGVDCPEGP